MGTYLCEACNTSFTPKYRSGRAPRYCSRACFSKSRQTRVVKTWNCEYCGSIVTRKVWGSDKARFCSLPCASRSRGDGHHNWNTCARCKGSKSQSRRDSLCRYCRAQEKSQQISSTTVGELRRRYSVHAFHSKVRNYARYGREKAPCAECGYDFHTAVCHVIPVAAFPDTATLGEINSEDNLVNLCPNHHWEFDHGALAPKQAWGLSKKKLREHAKYMKQVSSSFTSE